jgi:excisionase family DNA binding protein
MKGGTRMEKTTISVKELSAQMGISLTKAYELVKTRGFPVLHIGNKILIPVEAYRKWLNENTQNQ